MRPVSGFPFFNHNEIFHNPSLALLEA
jgi:hypothetical protein